jgi:hypothetical protein
VYWYQSADIKVDSPDPVTNQYQTPGIDIDYLQFEELVHDNPRRDSYVRVHAQVHNRGIANATNVQVRAFWANAGGGLPNLPADFWTAFPTSDPSDTSVWHPVGPARTIASVVPGQPRVASWSWLVPTAAPGHTCMLCAVRSAEDPVTTTSLAISTAVTMDNNVTLKNLHVDNVIAGATGADESGTTFFLDFAGFDKRRLIDIRFNPGTLPRGSRIHAYFPELSTTGPLRQAAVGLSMLRRDKPITLPRRPEEACGEPTQYDTTRRFTAYVSGKRGDTLPGLYGIVPGGALSAAIRVDLPKTVKAGEEYTFHVEHHVGNTMVGGSSYQIRVTERPARKPPRGKARTPRNRPRR